LELIWRAGEVRYKTTYFAGEHGFDAIAFGETLKANLLWSDRYVAGLKGVAERDEAPAEAVERADGRAIPHAH
jgi:hypothetical protein